MAFLFTWVKRFLTKMGGPVGRWATQPRRLPPRPLSALARTLWHSLLCRGVLFFLFLLPFFYGLSYTQAALTLGFLCWLVTLFLLCRKAPRHHHWRRLYRGVLRFFQKLVLWLYLCPFLLVPLFYFSFWAVANYLCLATEAFASQEEEGGGLFTWIANFFYPPPPPPVKPPVLDNTMGFLYETKQGKTFMALADRRYGSGIVIPPGRRGVWVPIDQADGSQIYYFAIWDKDGPAPGDLFYDSHGKKAAPEPAPPRLPRINHLALWGLEGVNRFSSLYGTAAYRFEQQLQATGVSLERFHQEIENGLDSLFHQRAEIVRLLPQLVGEPGLPLTAPPPLVPSGPLHPDYSRWGWSDWGRHALFTLLKPVVLSDLRKAPDLGLSWPLIYPSKELPVLVDVRCTLQQGFTINMSWQSDTIHWWRQTNDPFFFQLTKQYTIAPRPTYYPLETEEGLKRRWWASMTDDEHVYVEGVQRLTTFLEEELPAWKTAVESQVASIETLSQAYDLQGEIRLKEAELAYRWHFGVVKPATKALELVFDVKRTQMENMRLWFCREHTFTRTGCPEWFQSWERQTDLRELYSKMSRYSDSWRFNQRQGHLGRLSFFPFSEMPPYETEWGTIMRYWDCYDRPPLDRDQQQQSWEELLEKVKSGKAKIHKRDIFRNWLGPYV